MSEFCLKNNTVFIFKEENGVPVDISKIVNPELLPLRIKKNCAFDTFKEWLLKRCMPKFREGRSEAEAKFGSTWLSAVDDFRYITNFNYQSLTDHYWIKKRDETWEQINFFTNRYDLTVGNMFFEPWTVNPYKISYKTPEFTTTGLVRKRWRQDKNGISYLYKAGSFELKQEPLNEVLVSTIIERLNKKEIVSAGYDLAIEGVTMCSKCKCFITPDIDMVTAADIFFSEGESQDNSNIYERLISKCEQLEIPYAKEHIDWLIWIDNYTGNTDRHLNNIGFIRNLQTGKFIGPSPAFDFGNSYWNTKAVKTPPQRTIFGDKAAHIYKKMCQKINAQKLFGDNGYENLINSYPDVSDKKKEELIKAISDRNKTLILEKQQSLEGISR